MTKQWDIYESTIKNLYAENTLSVVRQIMIDQYGFKASVRAYRGRLDRWGIRKYNCRKRASSSPSGSIHEGSFSSGSDSTSPSMMAHSMATTFPHSAGGHLAMPRQINQQPIYNPVDDHQARMYNTQKSYDIKPKPVLSPPQTQISSGHGGNNSMGYTWDAAPAPPPLPHLKRPSDSSNSTSSDFDNFAPPNHNHNHSHDGGGSNSAAEIMAPPTYFGGFGAPVPVPMTAAMGHANNNNNNNNNNNHHMNHMNHNIDNNGNSNGGSNNNDSYAPMSNAEYFDAGMAGAAWEATTTGRHTATRR